MKYYLRSIFKFWEEVQKDEIIPLSTELAYKIVLSMFPFLVFLMTILGFLNIDGNLLLTELAGYVPPPILDLVDNFINDVIKTKNFTLLSTSLLISVYSSSSGIKATIRGINRTHGNIETRGFIKVMLLSILLMFFFVFSVVLCLVVLIFGDSLVSLLENYVELNDVRVLNLGSFIAVLLLLITIVCVIYKVGNSKRVTWLDVLPGALITVTFWLIASKLFNVYITHFPKSNIYGAIGSIFILLIWLNIIAVVLLVGSEVNAMIMGKNNER